MEKEKNNRGIHLESKRKKRKIVIVSLSITLFLTLLLGLSYAWFTLTLTGEKTNSLKIGNLSVEISENCAPIHMEDAYPMTETEGKQTTPCSFTLKNTGNIDSSYTIKLVDDGTLTTDQKANDNAFLYNIMVNGNPLVTKPLSNAKNRVLYNGLISPGETNTYEFRMWISESGVIEEDMKKSISAKIQIDANQIIPTKTAVKIKADIDEANMNSNLVSGRTVITTNQPFLWLNGNLWRVIGIYDDGRVRLLSDSAIAATDYGYPGQSDFLKTGMYRYLNEYYYSHLASSTKKMLADTDVCYNYYEDGDTICGEDTIDTCLSPYQVKVGLLSYGEKKELGDETDAGNSAVRYEWTSTKHGFSSMCAGDIPTGEYMPHYIRPIITLKSSSFIITGDGSYENPYRMQGEERVKANESITKVKTGEYIKYENFAYRVIEEDETGMKAVLFAPSVEDHYSLRYENETVREEYYALIDLLYHTGTTFNPTTGNGLQLQSFIKDKSKLVENATWYVPDYRFSTSNDVLDNLSDQSSSFQATISTPRIGDLYFTFTKTYLSSSGDLYIGYNTSYQDQYYILSQYKSGGSYHYALYYPSHGYTTVYEYGSAGYYLPMIYFKKTNTIKSGRGTYQDPYILK